MFSLSNVYLSLSCLCKFIGFFFYIVQAVNKIIMLMLIGGVICRWRTFLLEHHPFSVFVEI